MICQEQKSKKSYQVIGAGSVVTKDIPSNVIAVGNPCRVLREINDDDRNLILHGRQLELVESFDE